jgi:hypothetical protein
MNFLFSILTKATISFFTNLILRSSSERMLATLFFAIAEKFSKMTDNEIDDKLVSDMKEAYYGSDLTLEDAKNGVAKK